MELSREVHNLLDRIKKLSQQAQKNESYISTSTDTYLNTSHKIFDPSMTAFGEVFFSPDDIINVEDMDFSDSERWLYVSEHSLTNPYTGDLNEWLHQDFDRIVNNLLENDPLNTRKIIDTRTFTRPKKRISRPSLEQLTDTFQSEALNENRLNLTGDLSGPLHFKLSEPAFNTSFERILANASESIDSFQNMSPPSLVNSLCSSTFTTLMDSGYVNQDAIVPNEASESTVVCENENQDPNTTYDMKLNDANEQLNNTYGKQTEHDLNATFEKKYNLSGTNTITKKSFDKTKLGNLTASLKSSCPDINRTFEKNCPNDYNHLDLTFEKLSDSQPNLTEDLKRTILNQSMELMHDGFHSARSASGSADSLDERSSSISNCSKDSGTKILHFTDLDNLAKVQERSLQQAISTPKPSKNRLLMLDSEEILSPIQNCFLDEDLLSDSDESERCVTARSGFSQRSSPIRSIPQQHRSLDKLPLLARSTGQGDYANNTITKKTSIANTTYNHRPTENEIFVKPMEVVNRRVPPSIAHSQPYLQQQQTVKTQTSTSVPIRPKMRPSGLPRPTSMIGTGIPRLTSRIPAPKSAARPQLTRPSQQRQPSKSNWMDGCY